MQVEPTEDGPARGTRKSRVWLSILHQAALDKEVMRRRAKGEDFDPVTKQRVFMNRSLIIRDLIDLWQDSGMTVAQIREKLEQGRNGR